MLVNRKSLEWGVFLLTMVTLILTYVFLHKIISLIVLGGLIFLLIFLLFLQYTSIGIIIRYPKTHRILQKYSVIKEDNLSVMLKKPLQQTHRILYHFSKVWQTSPLVILVKTRYLVIHQKIMDLILKDIHAYHQDELSCKELENRIKKRTKLQSNEEVDTIIQRFDRPLKETG